MLLGLKKDNRFFKLIYKLLDKWNNIWDGSFLKPFVFLSIIYTVILAILIIYPLCYDTFINCNTDDVLQYYPYVSAFFEKVKAGNFSLYDTNLVAGSSFFSGVYYIPLDSFLGIAFILSYFIPAEIAYSMSNILRVIAGALLIYYVLIRKGLKPKTAFVVSLIFFVGGVTETCYIFPVYLGICFYAPLAMLIVDLCIEKKGVYYLLIPIYSLVIILYDFYIAYMLFAFLCVYFVVQMHITEKKFFLISGNFWVRFFEFMGLIFIGLMISCFFLLPSASYIINESTRATQSGNDYLWYYTTGYGETMKLSIRHYFTQWTNIFSPNNPHNLGLVQPGDYIREHASLYMTSGGIIYLVYFFLIWGKKENRLKFWILVFNVLFCIPLCAMIFTFNEWPYVRWFFIPYMLNLYGMALGMDKNDFKVGNHNVLKFFPVVFLGLGLGTMIYVLIKDPEIFIHYDKANVYFNPIVIGSIVCLSVYILLLLAAFILQAFKKDPKFIYKTVPVMIFAEVIFAGVVMFSSVGTTDYLSKKNEMSDQKDVLYEIGYNNYDGYRINLYTATGKNSLNGNIWMGVNHARFFQSFYNPQLNDYYADIHHEPTSSWNRTSMHGYTLLSGPMFNVKYVVTDWDCSKVKLPSKYYDLVKEKNFGNNNLASYYVLKDSFQFIVYDKVYTNDNPVFSSSNYFLKDLSLLEYGYVKSPNNNLSLDEMNEKEHADDLIRYKNLEKIKDSGIEFKDSEVIFNELNSSEYITRVTATEPDSYDLNDMYYVYNLTKSNYNKLLTMDAIYASPSNNKISSEADEHMYFRTDSQSYYPLHYNMGYFDCYDFLPKELLIKADKNASLKTVVFYGVNLDIYDNFINKQKEYTNRYFKLDGDSMRIKFTNTDSNSKIIKTGYTYSDDWITNNPNYQTCNINGGFLGIIVPEGTTNIDVSLDFIPSGYTTGCKISVIGCIIYLGITIPVAIILVYKRNKKKEKISI